MPGPKAPPVILAEDERQELLALIRAPKTPQHFSFRAQMILHLADGHNAHEVACLLGTSRLTVRRWRRHWLTRPHCTVLERLHDAPRPGTPATFSVEQWCQIMALACEPPANAGRPISHWTPRELADEAIKPDFSVVLFRPNFMLVPEGHPMKMHKNRRLLALPSPPDLPCGVMNQGTPHVA